MGKLEEYTLEEVLEKGTELLQSEIGKGITLTLDGEDYMDVVFTVKVKNKKVERKLLDELGYRTTDNAGITDYVMGKLFPNNSEYGFKGDNGIAVYYG